MASKSKKVEKKFVLSDSTVNCYGFRLLTSGYQLAEYERNPIGYYMHDRGAGVVVKWEDLKIEGDQLTGYPVINLSNARGEQTLQEVEDGFLNAASIGDIVVLEYSVEPEMMLPGQTGPTITKWTNKEISLVDVPGNSNALRLYDESDNPLELKDLMATTANFNQTIDMKQINLPITAALLANLSFKAGTEPKEAEVIAAINDLASRATTAEADVTTLTADKRKLTEELADLKAAGVKKEVDTLLAAGVTEKKLTNEMKEQLGKVYADKPTELAALLATMKPIGSVLENLKNGEAGSEEANWSWDEYEKNDPSGKKLANLRANNRTRYDELFNAKFKKD